MFKVFSVSDVLDVSQTKSVVAKSNLTDGNIPYVTRTASDNGYMGTCGNTDKINKGNCITIGAETGVAFYQPDDFVAGNKVYRLSREGLGEKEYLFLASILNIQTPNYSYSNARIPEKIKAEHFLLPVIKNSDPDHNYTADDIDWQYMRDRIAELERDRIAELDAYLKATGLDNYELTIDEEMALKGFFAGSISFGKIKIGDLFDIHPTAAYKLNNKELSKTPGTIPVLSNSSVNNGIGGYCGMQPTEQGNIITFSDTTTGSNTMFYQENPFIGYPHVQGMYPIGFQLDRYKAEFLISLIRKATGDGFSYANKFRRDIVANTVISLPINNDGSINWEYIYIYIRAVEKETIKEVVVWKEKTLNCYKSIV